MENINKFSIYRVWLLIRRSAVLNRKTWILDFAAGSGVLIIVSLLQAYRYGGNFNVDDILRIIHFVIFIQGFLITARMFHEIQTPARSQFFLTLPARTSEKLVSNWLLSSFMFIVAAYVGLFLVLAVSSLLIAGIFGSPIEFFNPFTVELIELMGHYLVLQSIFFLGSVYFRKNNFLNTVVSVVSVGIILVIWSVLLGWMLLDTPHFAITGHEFDLWSGNDLKTLLIVIYWGLIAPFFLTVSYFTLKEREI